MTSSPEALAEREAIVKWLRSRKDRLGQPSQKALRLADKIERGEHLEKTWTSK